MKSVRSFRLVTTVIRDIGVRKAAEDALRAQG
jgi:hypothetical protein